MSPLSRTKTVQNATDYGSPFVGPTEHVFGIPIAAGGLTVDTVDANGVLKPGVPLTKAGALPGVAPAFAYGCVAEATKLGDNNTTALAGMAGKQVSVVVIGAVNQDILEDILGRALTADEAASFDRAGSKVALI